MCVERVDERDPGKVVHRLVDPPIRQAVLEGAHVVVGAVVGAQHLFGHGGVGRGEQCGDLGQGGADRVGVVRVGHVVRSSEEGGPGRGPGCGWGGPFQGESADTVVSADQAVSADPVMSADQAVSADQVVSTERRRRASGKAGGPRSTR